MTLLFLYINMERADAFHQYSMKAIRPKETIDQDKAKRPPVIRRVFHLCKISKIVLTKKNLQIVRKYGMLPAIAHTLCQKGCRNDK